MNTSKTLISTSIGIALVSLSALGLAGCSGSTTPTASPTNSSTVSPTPTSTASAQEALAAELTYLIEEEKLAFDVYTVMNQTWGSQTFANILQSETNHQSQVLAVMKTYGVSDPRSSEIGVFENDDLQKLYDTLIAQGKTSQLDAYKVGVIIEETDIADLQKMLATNPPADVASMMNSLLSGSQNHLAAFSKKV